MSKSAKRSHRPRPNPSGSQRSGRKTWALVIAGLAVTGAAIALLRNTPASAPVTSTGTINTTQMPPQATATLSPAPSEMEVKQAVMVTVELDFGPQIPSIATALQHIERRHQPEDGTGRVFAILEAYGGPTEDGRKLHMSMRVSLEKTGTGSLVFRRTGETLWSSKVLPAKDGTRSAAASGLTILLNDGAGRTYTVDGSSNPPTVLQAMLKESGQPVDQAWPDGAEREVTFFYSGCGCPVKVLCRRVGSKTIRTKEMPVIFPDDPDAVAIIQRLMAW